MAASSESVFIATLYTSTLYLKYTHTRRSAQAQRDRSILARVRTQPEPAAHVASRSHERGTRLTSLTRGARYTSEVYTRDTREVHTRGILYTIEGSEARRGPADPSVTEPCGHTTAPPPSPSRLPLAAAPAHTRPTQRQHSASTALLTGQPRGAGGVRPTCDLRATSGHGLHAYPRRGGRLRRTLAVLLHDGPEDLGLLAQQHELRGGGLAHAEAVDELLVGSK